MTLAGLAAAWRSTIRRPTAAAIIEGYKQLIARTRTACGSSARRSRLSATRSRETPFEGYYTPEKEKIHLAVNDFIRSGAFDGVIDFDKVIVDSDKPGYSLPKYDKGDHLHPNPAGYKAMAGAIGLKTLTTK